LVEWLAVAVTRKSRDDRKKPKSFEALMDELEKIVAQLEGGDLPLEKSIELFEKGMSLASDGMQTLDAAEKKVEMLLQEDGKERMVPFEPSQDDGDS